MRKLLVQPVADMSGCLTRLAECRKPYRAMALTVVAMLVTWFIYVPIHELLHVLGCVATGGTVSELEVAPQYGGYLLAKWFDFVVCGGDYAGRLSGFDWKGSSLIYLATDFCPYILSVVLGVPLLRLCARRSRPILLGAAVVIGLAPFYNVIGDYYEIGSVTTTAVVTLATGGDTIAFEGIRSDDVFKLLGDVCLRPDELGLEGPAALAAGSALILVSFLLGIVAAFATYALGGLFARILGLGDPGTER